MCCPFCILEEKERTMKNDVIDHINLELSREKSKNTIACKKNDTALRRVQATVSNNGAIVNLEDVVYAVVKATKPDGTKIYNACTVSGDCLWFVVTTQMLTAPGDVICELEITWLDGATITTPTFTIHVYNTIYTGAESQNEYNGLTQAVAEAVSAKISAETSEANALNSATDSSTSAAASAGSASAAEASATAAAGYESGTAVLYQQTKDYIDNFIEDQEEHNRTLQLANAYTNQKIAEVNGNTGLSEDLTVPNHTNIVNAVNTTYALAKEKSTAMAMLNYSQLVAMLNTASRGTFNTGQSIYIATVDVPDVWIYGEIGSEESPVTYTYTDDEDLIDDVNVLGILQIGYYYIAFLETQKVDLTPITAAIAALEDKYNYPS
jgi:hypothetical protein